MRFFIKCVEEMWDIKGNNKIKGFDELLKNWKSQVKTYGYSTTLVKQMSVFLGVTVDFLQRIKEYERIEEYDQNKE